MGKTVLFIFNPPTKGTILLTEYDRKKLVGRVERKLCTPTKYGYQDAVVIVSESEVEVYIDSFCVGGDFYGEYDLDTGILLRGGIFIVSTLKALNIKVAHASFRDIVDTNIDLGPPNLFEELKMWIFRILFILLLCSPVIAVIIYLWKRKVKKK